MMDHFRKPRTKSPSVMANESDVEDRLSIRRVANGWVLRAGRHEVDDFTHVYTLPDDLASHVKKWAKAQER